MIKFSDFFHGLVFANFEDAVAFCFSAVPWIWLFLFLISVIFAIFYDIFHLGGK